jgi:uncharacterized protein YndB with AHSA1/START domain
MSWSMSASHDAPVSPDAVFRCYTDPATWGSWGHNTAWGRGEAPIRVGSRVKVRARRYPKTYDVLITEVVEGRRVVCEVRPVGVVLTSTYEVTPTPTGARLEHTISCAGPLERGYRLLEGRYTQLLREETARLARLVAGDGTP